MRTRNCLLPNIPNKRRIAEMIPSIWSGKKLGKLTPIKVRCAALI